MVPGIRKGRRSALPDGSYWDPSISSASSFRTHGLERYNQIRARMNVKFERIAQSVSETLHGNKAPLELPLESLILYAREAIASRQEQEPNLQGRVDVLIDPRDRTVAVVDNGSGMDALDIHQLVRTMCYAGRIEVTTRKPADPTGFRWTMTEDYSSFMVRETDSPIGSTIKLFLRPDAPWPETDLISQTLKSQAKMSPFPIFFNGEQVSLGVAGARHEFAYDAMPPNRSFTAPVVYRVRGRGKPLVYDNAADD